MSNDAILFDIPPEAFANAHVVGNGTGCPESGIYIGTLLTLVPAKNTKTPGNFEAMFKVPGYEDYDKVSRLVSVAYDADGNQLAGVTKVDGRNNGAYTFGLHCGLTDEDMKAQGLQSADLLDAQCGLWIETFYSDDGQEVPLYCNVTKTMTVAEAEKLIGEGVEVPRRKAPKREGTSGGGQTQTTQATQTETTVVRRRTAPAAQAEPAKVAEPTPPAQTEAAPVVRRRRPGA